MSRVETTILNCLMYNEDYHRKAIPFLKLEYFSDNTERVLFKLIHAFSMKYNKLPTVQVVKLAIEKIPELNEDNYKLLNEYTDSFLNKSDVQEDLNWLLDQTEDWCKNRAIYNAVRESISIIDKQSSKTNGDIPKLLSDALAVSFDGSVGHDFIEDSEKRFEFYNTKVDKIPFDLEYFNKITGGGVPRKTLNIILAGTNVGKTLAMCHFASGFLSSGMNVLYITLEISEEEIAKRIDSNLLNVDMSKLVNLSKSEYDYKMSILKNKTTGKLIVKEYPTGVPTVAHFEHLLSELKMKRKFIPDVVFVDYLNIASSTRKVSVSDSYIYAKAIAEELRGMAVKYNIPIFSATQVNRSGFGNSDPGLENTSESFGVPATADFMVAMISTEQLESMNQIMFKQLKNRYADVTVRKRFVVGIDRAKMRLYDLDESAQANLFENASGGKEDKDDKPAFDRGRFGSSMKAERRDDIGSRINEIKFGEIK